MSEIGFHIKEAGELSDDEFNAATTLSTHGPRGTNIATCIGILMPYTPR